jgi:hypothetical protein
MPPRAPSQWVAVTPSDTVDLSPRPNVGLYVTGGGAVKFDGDGGVAATVTVPANFYLWGMVRRVYATGTTATGLFALV